jgi:hypothetical protein
MLLVLHLRPAPSHRSSWLPILTPRGPGRRRRPPQARPQLLGHALHGRAGAAILSGPAPLLKPTHDHDPAALRQGLRGMLGLVRQTITVKNDGSCSHRPDTATEDLLTLTPRAHTVSPRCGAHGGHSRERGAPCGGESQL